MKTLWNAISIVAVAHFVGFLGLTAYLALTNRVTRERIDETREIFAMTIAQQTQIESKAAEAAALEAARLEHEASMNAPSVGADGRVDRIRTLDELLMERELRAEADVENVARYLDSMIADIEAARKQLDADRAAFEAERRRLAGVEIDAQFKQTAEIFGGLNEEQQKAFIQEYLDRGETNLAIDLLDSLDTRSARKFFEQFETPEEQALAAELLVRLKNRGLTIESGSP